MNKTTIITHYQDASYGESSFCYFNQYGELRFKDMGKLILRKLPHTTFDLNSKLINECKEYQIFDFEQLPREERRILTFIELKIFRKERYNEPVCYPNKWGGWYMVLLWQPRRHN